MQTRIGFFPLLFGLSSLALLAATPPAAEDENLWLRYPTISPDGASLAFSHRGDIWVVPAAGGTAVALTRHPAHDTRPVWSHDGRTIAFASDRYGNFDVFTVAASGGALTRVTAHSSDDLPSDFSPDDQHVIFSSARLDTKENILFPSGVMAELYRAPAGGGRAEVLLTTPAHDARYSADGRYLAFHDRKGYEDEWRKHHVSSVTRDVWIYDTQQQTYTMVSGFAGEDRSPAWAPDGQSLYYLSEQSGSFNVWRQPVPRAGAQATKQQLTTFKEAPVRSLSISRSGTLCFGYRGGIWVLAAGAAQPRRVPVIIRADDSANPTRFTTLNSEVTEFALSQDGKQLACIVRGEVFAVSPDGKMVKRVTNTPEQERGVTFSADGKKLIYASQRGGSWNLYQASFPRADDLYFFNATLIAEETVLADGHDNQRPHLSPDGKEVAYFSNRHEVKIYNLAEKTSRTVVTEDLNFAYTDSTLWFDWAPDNQWLVASYTDRNRYSREVGLYKVRGEPQPMRNLTRNGFDDGHGLWAVGGTAIAWASDREGLHDYQGRNAQTDVFLQFLTQAALDRFKLTKAELALVKEREDAAKKTGAKSAKKPETKAEGDDAEKKKETEDSAPAEADAEKKTESEKKPADSKSEKSKPVVIEFDGLDDRVVRVTPQSARLSDFALSADGEKLVYFSRQEKGYDLFLLTTREKENKLLAKIGANRMSLRLDAKGEQAFVLADGKLSKVAVADGKTTAISVAAELQLNLPQERSHLFDHVWRLIDQKFYKPDLHGVDWAAQRREYARFLPSIADNHEFAELVSEMLGELNASHTGLRYRPKTSPENDATASLGTFFDPAFTGNGLRVQEVVAGGPLTIAAAALKPGHLVEKIDGVLLTPQVDWQALLNRKAGKQVLLDFLDPADNRRWDAVVKPITRQAEGELLYRRWVKGRRADVARLSGGRLGYVHVRSMSDEGYRQLIEDGLGQHSGAEGLVVDTRFNGGGWLHDELVSFLGGRKYTSFAPRGRPIGEEPTNRWHRPSIVLMSESNYSDAHFFPYAYKTLGIGKLVGMPVPGTATAVWWEDLMDPNFTVGVPQMGGRDLKDQFLENQQLEPDIRVPLLPGDAAAGRDTQLESAVKSLLDQIPPKPVAGQR